MAAKYSGRLAAVDEALVAWADAHQNGLFDEIGWSGGIMSKWIEYQGQPPRGTGQDQSNLGTIIAVEKMRQERVTLALQAQGALNRAILKAQAPVQLLMLRYLKRGTKGDRAKDAGMGIKSYQTLIDCAMEIVAIEMQERRVA